jgi:adenylate kinase family enzyme
MTAGRQGLPQPAPRRVVVVGTTGSGKTTFAREVAAIIDAPHTELDALFWEPGWTPAEPEVFRARALQIVVTPAWVIDGNYGPVNDLVWGHADTFVWLDYPMPLVMRRLLARSFRRSWTGEELWNGNRERFTTQFLSRDSLLLWACQTHWRRRREYPDRLRLPAFAHLDVHRLYRPDDTDRLLRELRRRCHAQAAT